MKIDLNKFNELIKEKYLNSQTHPTFPLLIFNYTPKVQYERFWNEETLMCRGLITTLEGEIVARPFKKFFNLDEHSEGLPNETFSVYDKLDGSLGILYFYDDKPYIATRGSFTSEQAERANKIFQKKYSHLPFNKEHTYLFEIIYPENRIVVDYGAKEDLVLLAVLDTETGKDLELPDWELSKVKYYDGLKDWKTIRALQWENSEGFVIRFESGFRVKLKFTEYVRLHKILTNFTSRDIWESLREKRKIEEILDNVPDEFYQWVKKIVSQLEAEYKKIEDLAKSEFKVLENRKDTALYFNKCKYPAILFKLLDNKDYSDFIWRLIKPEIEKPFKIDEES